jgi:hypothetical protein
VCCGDQRARRAEKRSCRRGRRPRRVNQAVSCQASTADNSSAFSLHCQTNGLQYGAPHRRISNALHDNFAGMLLALAISAHAKTARCPCDVVDGSKSRVDGGTLMFGGIFLWLLGVPFSIIVLLWLFGVLG